MHTCWWFPLWGNWAIVFTTIKRVFTIGLEHCAAFKYLGLTINQYNSEIIIDQVIYIKSVDYISISNDRKNQKDELLCIKELKI